MTRAQPLTEYDRIQAAARYIAGTATVKPKIGVVLGSGLGDFAHTLKLESDILFTDIPHFKAVTVQGHSGHLLIGTLASKALAVLQGRYHYYEGHSLDEVIFPVRVLSQLGVDILILTNAAGGINPGFAPGDLMAISDHINLLGQNPLRGANDERIGPRFADMSEVYDRHLLNQLRAAMRACGVPDHAGVYAALSGPSYETPAEIRMLRTLGAEAVGMSTVPEAIAARHAGMAVAAISCITNVAAGLSAQPMSHADVTAIATRVQTVFIRVLSNFIAQL